MPRYIDADILPKLFDEEYKTTKKLIEDGETYLDNLAVGFSEAAHIDKEMLCNETYCPWWQDHRCSPTLPTCEGAWCEEAWQQYKDSLEDAPYEEVSKEGKGT